MTDSLLAVHLLLTDLQSKSTKDLIWLSIFPILVQMLYLSIDVMNRCVSVQGLAQ